MLIMKRILLLTDFSENANHAAQSAAQLAITLSADLILFSSYLKIPLMPVLTEGPWENEGELSWGDSTVERLDLLAGELRLQIEDAQPGLKPSVSCCYGEGNLGLNVKKICKDQHISLVVMGSCTGGNLNHLFFGSDSASVIRQAPVPVLVIPPEKSLYEVKKMMIATDFTEGDWDAVVFLTEWCMTFRSELAIVHIQLPHEQMNLNEDIIPRFLYKLNKLDYPWISYHEIRGKEVIARLNRLCKESNTDLLAIVHRKRSFFESLSDPSVSKKALIRQQLPLIVFPSKG